MITDPFYYWAGVRYGRRLLEYLERNDPRWRRRVARGERFFRRFGIWAIVLAPFLPAPSPLFYMAAGESGMNFALFIVADLLGTLMYIGAVVAAGWVAGQAAVSVAQTISQYSLWVIVGIVVAVFAWSFVQAWRAPRSR
jgi:membrane protein DedA with SNARE-associated domain